MDFNLLLRESPAKMFRVVEKNNHEFQLIAPLFHEDGDMMTIFLKETEDGRIDIFDHGMSLMRLSYTFDIDTDNKEKVLNSLIMAKDAENRNGDICLTVKPEQLFSGIMTYSQLVDQVCNLNILSREAVSDMFYDNLNVMVEQILPDYHYEKDYYLEGYSDMKIDYVFQIDRSQKPLCLFGIKDTNKAQQTTICCLQLARKRIPFKSVAVFENMDSGITRFARNSVVNTVGKVFSDLDGFKENASEYFREELRV